MSIYSAMRAGVSGLAANASALATISDNIANVNTVGFKRSQTDFSALINAQNTQSTFNAGGVIPQVRRAVGLQGALEQTNSATDFAINGSGFFIVSNDPDGAGGATGGLFTRAGNFSLDANGRLVNAQGYYLLGAPLGTDGEAEIGPSSLASLQTIDLSGVGSLAQPTTEVSVAANLDSRTTSYVAGGSSPAYVEGAMATGLISAQVERGIDIYDSLGATRSLTLGYLKTGTNTWRAEIYSRPADISTQPGGLIAAGEITFNSDGTVQTINSSAGSAAAAAATYTGEAMTTGTTGATTLSSLGLTDGESMTITSGATTTTIVFTNTPGAAANTLYLDLDGNDDVSDLLTAIDTAIGGTGSATLSGTSIALTGPNTTDDLAIGGATATLNKIGLEGVTLEPRAATAWSALEDFTIDWATTTGAADQPVTFDMHSALTQFATPSALSSATADGTPPGDLTGVSVSTDGILTAQFSNGRTEPLYLIPIATFLNPDGLQAERGGAYRATLDSGLFTVNTAGAGGAGQLQAGALESSNVDLGSEFTDLITTQRAYSASSRVITTADQMLEELISIKR